MQENEWRPGQGAIQSSSSPGSIARKHGLAARARRG
jgi:hypothetical protein